MKIQVFDQNSKKPLANTKFQLQVRGKDSGYVSTTTDASGYFQLDEKYQGQQISTTTTGGGQNQWVSATDGAKLYTTAGSTQKQPTTYKNKKYLNVIILKASPGWASFLAAYLTFKLYP